MRPKQCRGVGIVVIHRLDGYPGGRLIVPVVNRHLPATFSVFGAVRFALASSTEAIQEYVTHLALRRHLRGVIT
ncbi:hypothetical protein D3C76_1042650 [compost metagenome]